LAFRSLSLGSFRSLSLGSFRSLSLGSFRSLSLGSRAWKVQTVVRTRAFFQPAMPG
jgi:hypothetical protein